MEISYAITVCTELEEIKQLLPFLLKNKREEDEVVVLFDSTNGSEEVKKYLLQTSEVKAVFDWFKGDFSEWKNKLNSLCTGDYIFNIDADETITETFMSTLPTILENNPEVEFYWVPRENYVTGLTPKHIQEWGWRVDVQNIYKTILKCIKNTFTEIIENTHENITNSNTGNLLTSPNHRWS